MGSKSIKTLFDLREALNTFTDEQLKESDAELRRWDDMPLIISSVEVTDEDIFYNEDSEGAYPVSMYNPEDYDGHALHSDYNCIIPAGQIYLLNDEDND